MKTKIVLRNENLWVRIQGFSLDAENASFPFSRKLAKEENWSIEFTGKAIEEYKKFVYLCCISPNGASPSEIVDRVWHMHLIYTENYWEEFCPNILKRSLHHHPSIGGKSENIKHQNWFSETMVNYREIFSEDAPEDIWKNVIPKNKSKKPWFRRLIFFPGITVLLLLSSCSDKISEVFITVVGGFIALFIVLNIFAFIIGAILSKNKDRDKNDHNADGGSSCSSGGSSCSSGSSCGSSCGGGGCGGCGS